MDVRTVVVLCGSKSDFKQITPGIALLRVAEARGLIKVIAIDRGVEVCSAHRNPKKFREKLQEYTDMKVDAILACAGKLAVLIGDSDAILRNDLKNSHTRVIAVPLKGKTEDASKAAYLSAKEVPNSEFIFREEFFQNPETAFKYAISGELPELQLKEQVEPESFSLAKAYHFGRRKYPANASYDGIIEQLELGGLFHYYTGKTRETFINPVHPDLLYMLATDRISIFDIVLNSSIPGKGEDLTMMTIFWLTKVFSDIPNHLVAYGGDIVEYLPPKLRGMLGNPGLEYLKKNMLVVKRTKPLMIEGIGRANLSGSGLLDYNATGNVCGIQLPSGLIDGSELPDIIFTPSSKAAYGDHDENISFEDAVKIVGEKDAEFVRDMTIYLLGTARQYMLPLGIIVADTKFEFGKDQKGNVILIDEILTPDSSRFWSKKAMADAMKERKTPPSFDKQPVRDAGKAAGVKENQDWIPPENLRLQTSANYHYMVELATVMSREQFWKEEMGITED